MDLEQQIEVFNRLCPCCGVDPETKPYSIFCDNMELADLGEGYVLFFKLMIYFGFIAIFFYGINIYKVAVNLRGSVCVERSPEYHDSDLKTFGKDTVPPCFKDWINQHSVANYGVNRIDAIERGLMVAFLSVFWLSMAFVYNRLLAVSKQIDEANDTPSDWTLMLKNVPLDQDEQTILHNLENDIFFSKGAKIEIKKVSLAYNLEEYLVILGRVNEKKTLVKKMQFKESKLKTRISSLPDAGDDKPNPFSMSIDHLELSGAKFGMPAKQISIDKSIVMRKRGRPDYSPELVAELDKLRALNIEVHWCHVARQNKAGHPR